MTPDQQKARDEVLDFSAASLTEMIDQARGCAANHYGEDEPIDGQHILRALESLAKILALKAHLETEPRQADSYPPRESGPTDAEIAEIEKRHAEQRRRMNEVKLYTFNELVDNFQKSLHDRATLLRRVKSQGVGVDELDLSIAIAEALALVPNGTCWEDRASAVAKSLIASSLLRSLPSREEIAECINGASDFDKTDRLEMADAIIQLWTNQQSST